MSAGERLRASAPAAARREAGIADRAFAGRGSAAPR